MCSTLIELRKFEGDISAPENLMAYGHYLLAFYQSVGGLAIDGHVATGLELATRHELRSFSDRLGSMLPQMPVRSLVEMAELYDLTYRLGFGKKPDAKIYGYVHAKCKDAWLSGRRDMSELMMARLVQREMQTGVQAVNPDIAGWFCAVIEDWCRELNRWASFNNIGVGESLGRLSILLNENLYAYYGSGQLMVKAKWVDMALCDDLRLLSTEDLKSYHQFLSYFASVYLPEDKVRNLTDCAVTELLTRDNLHPFEREACRLGSEIANRFRA